VGKRSRRRVGGAPTAKRQASVDVKQPPAKPAATADSAKGPPAAPWGDLPITEIAVLVGLVMTVGGFLVGGKTGTIVLVIGLLLASLAGLEQAVREHRAGYRSHAMVIAGLPAAVAIGVMVLLGAPREAFPPVAVGVLIAAWIPLRAAYQRKAADEEQGLGQ